MVELHDGPIRSYMAARAVVRCLQMRSRLARHRRSVVASEASDRSLGMVECSVCPSARCMTSLAVFRGGEVGVRLSRCV